MPSIVSPQSAATDRLPPADADGARSGSRLLTGLLGLQAVLWVGAACLGWLAPLSPAFALVLGGAVWGPSLAILWRNGWLLEKWRAEAANLQGAAEVRLDSAERRLADAESDGQRLRSIVEHIPYGVLMLDDQARIQLANPQVEELFGYAPDELIGEPIETLLPRELGDRRQSVRDDFLREPKTGPVGCGRELFGVRREGIGFPVDLRLSPLQTDGGSFVLAGVIDDTERQHIQQSLKSYAGQLESANRDLRKAQSELESKNQELDEFTYVASHDLQEPLRKLVSFSKLLEEDLGEALNDDARRDLMFIVDAAARMRQLVHDLLTLSRSGRAEMHCTPVDLDECRERALDALRLRIEETGAQLCCPDLPTVNGDATMLTQLYQNLIGNALKFTAEEAPQVEVTVKDSGTEWILGVRDNGIGLKPEYAERIFKPFQRLHRRNEHEGTGIGLSICRKTVERHGGQIWVESAPGAGAHFRFTLPKSTENDRCAPVEQCVAATPSSF